MEDRYLPRVWTGEEYYYPVFSELGITYQSSNKEFTEENIKSLDWAFGWHFGIFVEDKESSSGYKYVRNPNNDIEFDGTLEMPTGLRDKNSKLIFENDIVHYVKHTNMMLGGERYAKVFWSSNYQGFAMETQYGDIYDLVDFDIEVVGNINENPELLEINNGR